MRVLTVVKGPSGLARPTAMLTIKSGRELWLCNPLDELTEAMEAAVPFKAHSVVAMGPRELIVNPAHVATIEKASGYER